MRSKPPKVRCNCFHYHHHPKSNSLGHVRDIGGDNNGDGKDNGGDSDGDGEDNVNGEDNFGDDEDNDGGDNDNVQNECNQCVGTTTLLCRLALMQMSF